MKKEKRKWVKDEKRLIKLLYRTGIIDKYTSIDSLYWDYYHKKYKPIWNEYHSAFVKVARKKLT